MDRGEYIFFISSLNPLISTGNMGANASVGNTEKITAGSNTGCIGSGNKINIS